MVEKYLPKRQTFEKQLKVLRIQTLKSSLSNDLFELSKRLHKWWKPKLSQRYEHVIPQVLLLKYIANQASEHWKAIPTIIQLLLYHFLQAA